MYQQNQEVITTPRFGGIRGRMACWNLDRAGVLDEGHFLLDLSLSDADLVQSRA